MNVQRLSSRDGREPTVLAHCEAFAVMLTLKELAASGLGTDARPAAPAFRALPPTERA